jgi:DNA invertase Pin-like site-specific DNA recombinase
MDRPGKNPLRCAIYTRKSSEHNLDLEFNSLDAQREACEAYIKSQAHEGWRLAPGRYDDGAFSGASLDRPALQKLLKEVAGNKIDVIVVYKVDRLTRSLSDFAKLVELFDQHTVSFVSVTQSFNTTSSMGRLTLNVLLSFAQFEREVIGERVRDKIAASKAKGIWVGGSIPLGYAVANKKVIAVPDEVEAVRVIFRRYLELRSIGALAADLDRQGIRTRRRTLSNGKTRGGIRFGVGTLGHLLRNRFYVGQVVYRGKIHDGEHPSILDVALFDAVQAKLAAGAHARLLKIKASSAILAGLIFDDRGNRMTPTHTNKKGARYRYYVSHSMLQNRKDAAAVLRVSAPEIESTVIEAVRRYLGNSKSAQHAAPTDDRSLVREFIHRVIVAPDNIKIHFGEYRAPKPTSSGSKLASPKQRKPAVLVMPWNASGRTSEKGILPSPQPSALLNAERQDTLLTAIAKAKTWVDDLISGKASLDDIAKREGKVERHIRLLAPLAFASPTLISHVYEGRLANTTVTGLAQRMPYSWAKQRDEIASA